MVCRASVPSFFCVGRRTGDIGAVMKARREELGLNKSEATRRAKAIVPTFSRGSWHEIETGHREKSEPSTINAIAHALEMEPEDLRARTGRFTAAGTSSKTLRSGRTREMSVQLQLDELRRLILDIGDQLADIGGQVAELRELTAQAVHGGGGGDKVVE
jgi:hypothetical protein